MNQQDIFQIIANHAKDVIPKLTEHDFQFNDALRDLGANSIDRSEIVMMTMESLALSVPLIETARAQNMGELAEILYEKL